MAEIEYTSIRDDVTFTRSGEPVRQKRVEFYIGKHGPFVERFDSNATAADIDTRIRQLHSTLVSLPTQL
jgi:hypothetical protein